MSVSVTFTCKRCRQALFSKADVVDHEPNPSHSFSYRRLAKNAHVTLQGDAEREGPRMACSSYFIAEPLSWMKVRRNPSVRISCLLCLTVSRFCRKPAKTSRASSCVRNVLLAWECSNGLEGSVHVSATPLGSGANYTRIALPHTNNRWYVGYASYST